MRFVPEITARERAEGNPDDPDVFEYRVDRRMWRESLAWASAHPGEVARAGGRQAAADVERVAQRAGVSQLADAAG